MVCSGSLVPRGTRHERRGNDYCSSGRGCNAMQTQQAKVRASQLFGGGLRKAPDLDGNCGTDAV